MTLTQQDNLTPLDSTQHTLLAKKMGIDTYQEPVIYMRSDCSVCRAEGFEALARVCVELGSRKIIATLNVIKGDLLKPQEAGLSEVAWNLLQASDLVPLRVSHPEPLESLAHVRAKVHGVKLSAQAYSEIITDVALGRYSDVHLSSFITACAANHMDAEEMVALTKAMINAGDRLTWDHPLIVDKHCVGGLPGNRTTLIVVPIVTSFGLTMPKTSSRAITSPAGTADVMATMAPVNLDTQTMKRVVEKEGGCIVWGGSVRLSPADDILIRVERPLDLDSEGQLVASVLSKKVAAGSTHVLIDIPVGPTAKVRSPEAAQLLSSQLIEVGRQVGLEVHIVITEGDQPVGMGVGPALEAYDALAVLQNQAEAPADLKERALRLAGLVLEMSQKVSRGQGFEKAREILESGQALKKFEAICLAQGGFFDPPKARYYQVIEAPHKGRVAKIHNRLLARVAKLAGAPVALAAGLKIHAHLGDDVAKGQPLYTIYSEAPGELNYALRFVEAHPDILFLENGGS